MTSPSGGILAYNGSTNGSDYKIGFATSTDMTTWTKVAGPSFVAGSASWESSLVKDPCIVHGSDQHEVVMYYAGYSGSAYQIGRARSVDQGRSWDRTPGPVLPKGGSGAWDEAHVNFPFVMYDAAEADASRRWKAWYSGSAAATPAKFAIGYAYSADGISWTKHPSNPVITAGTSGAWDDEGTLSPAVHRTSSSSWTLFYGGRPQTGATSAYKIGKATFTDPEGSYTKDGSNPIVTPSTTNQALTGTTSSGASTVTVASTAGFTVGEPVLLRDSTNTVQQTKVQSIDSATQLTITDPASKTWTTANTSTIRSAYYESITPRSITVAGSTFVLWATAFQQFAGSPFYERSVAYTASSIGGTWTPDHTRGLILPLGSTWDTLSAENPSVIGY